jgi:hypothetical protein
MSAFHPKANINVHVGYVLGELDDIVEDDKRGSLDPQRGSFALIGGVPLVFRTQF